MYSHPDSPATQKSWRRQCLEMVFCLLVLICVGNPNFHSFSHLVQLSHKHPTGSVYSHADSDSSLTESERSMLAEFDHGSYPVLPLAQGDFRLHNGAPSDQDRDDGDSPIFFTHLLEESEASCIAHYEVFIEHPLPALDQPSFECTGIYSSAELGTIGARGPPA